MTIPHKYNTCTHTRTCMLAPRFPQTTQVIHDVPQCAYMLTSTQGRQVLAVTATEDVTDVDTPDDAPHNPASVSQCVACTATGVLSSVGGASDVNSAKLKSVSSMV